MLQKIDDKIYCISQFEQPSGAILADLIQPDYNAIMTYTNITNAKDQSIIITKAGKPTAVLTKYKKIH